MISIRRVFETFLSLNVGFAIVFSMWTFFHRGNVTAPAFYLVMPIGRLFEGIALMTNRLLHLDRANVIGREIAPTVLVLAIAAAVFGLLRVTYGIKFGSVVSDAVSGAVTLTLVPSLWLYAYLASWMGPGSFWTYYLPRPAAEIIIVCTVLLTLRKHRRFLVICLATMIFHHIWWLTWMWSDLNWTPVWWDFPLRPPVVFYFAFPCSGFAWFYYSKQSYELPENTRQVQPSVT